LSWLGALPRVPGDVIVIEDHNLLLQAIDGLLGYVRVEGRPQPFQVDKPSILLLEGEGATTPGLPLALHVFLSSTNIIFDEVAGADIIPDGYSHIISLTVPVPENYWVYWLAPYGFIKSALLF
jgi:hypothetical protein